MTLRRSFALLLGLAFATTARADILVDFSDHPLPANSFDNGSNGAGGFFSNGVFFNNQYNTTFESWRGWSLSNVNNPTVGGFGNQYAAITGTGVGGSGTYAVAFDGGINTSYINLPTGTSPLSLALTNTAYAYESMLNGDAFAKKFTTGDFLKVEISGYSGTSATGSKLGEVDVFLANYQNEDDRPLNTWMNVDLSSLGSAQSLGFTMTSSDVGSFGINTPLYFALDNLALSGTQVVPEPSSLLLVATGLAGLVVVRRRLKNPRTAAHPAQSPG